MTQPLDLPPGRRPGWRPAERGESTDRSPPTPEALAFWEDPARVAEFAAREPDVRLLDLMKQYADPRATRVLDLGCAGGRNTEPLLRAGFDVIAVDATSAMVAATRARIAALAGAAAAERRVLAARMDDLSFARDGSFDLVIALGIYQQAQGEAEWTRSLAETARVVRGGGRVLVANFAPGTGPRANPPALVAGTRFVYTGLGDGLACLLGADELDREFARIGFAPEVPTATVDRSSEESRRITVNALYSKAPQEGPVNTTAVWTEKQVFRVDFPGGEAITLASVGRDEHPAAGPSPMEAVQAALACCSGMDVVSSLEKMRKTLAALRIEVVAARRDEVPRVYTDLALVYHIDGPDLDRESVARAVSLSQEKYCSVAAMLRPAAALSYRIILNGTAIPG